MFAFDPIDLASKAGTLPMQAILLLAIFALAWVVIYLHKKQNADAKATSEEYNRKLEALHDENKESMNVWQTKIETERAAMSLERTNRIASLMTMVEKNTTAYGEVKAIIESNKVATEANTNAIRDLREFIRGQTDIITALCGEKGLKRK